MNQEPPQIIVIVGETASGKSSLAMSLAQRSNGEIIAADSATFRKGMDIGTAKPSVSDQQLVKHHLIDIIEPDNDFSAAQFKKLATDVIQEITGRGHVPIIVGGTGLYIDGLLYDYKFLDSTDSELRGRLNKLSVQELRNEASRRGLSLNGLDVDNPRRLIRHIETNGAKQERTELRKNTELFGLTIPGSELKRRIEIRTNAMIENGLAGEVETLAAKYGWHAAGMQAIGYKEWFDYYVGSQTLAETTDRIITATNQLAKRQRTWFFRNKSIQWISNFDDLDSIVDLLTLSLNK